MAAPSADDGGEILAFSRGGAPYRLFVETMVDGALTVTRDGTILLANPAVAGITGLPVEALPGRQLSSIVGPDSIESLPALLSDDPPGRPTLLTVRNGDETIPVEVTARTVELDGVSASCLLVSTRSDRVFRDRQLLAHAAELATNERRFRALVARAAEVFVVTDADGVILELYGPTEEYLGGPAELLTGQSIYDFSLPEDRARAERFVQARLSRADTLVPEEFWLKRDGRWRCLSVAASNLLDDPDVGGVVFNARDVTQLKRLDEAREAISAINGAVVRSSSESALYEHACRIIARTRTVDLCVIALEDPNAPSGSRIVAAAGEPATYARMLENLTNITLYPVPLTQALEQCRIQRCDDLRSLPSRALWQRAAVDHGHQSLLAVPLVVDTTPVGVVGVFSGEAGVFTPDTVGVLDELAQDLAFGVHSFRTKDERTHYQQRFESSLESAIQAISTAAELRDPYTAGHQRRVSQLAAAIATAIGMDEQDVKWIGLAASLHDIGKLAIPAEILTKPSRLSDIEFTLVKEHPGSGYDILRHVEFPVPVGAMVHQHHERLDGSGYPRGLRHGAIHIGARLIAVADTVEAIHSHRPYRPGRGIDTALEVIAGERTRRLDPQAVDACTELFRERGFAFDDEPLPTSITSTSTLD